MYTRSPSLWTAVLYVLWLPLFLVLFPIALSCNLWIWARTYMCLGGAVGVARRTTQPRRNILMRWILRKIDVFNVRQIRERERERDGGRERERERRGRGDR